MKIQEFDFSINVLKVLLWRHNNAVNLQSLLQNKQNALDTLNEDFWGSWFNDVFNIETANKFGLALWAIILNIPLTIDEIIESEVANSNFGFGEFRKNFNNGNFTGVNNMITLTLEEARMVLKLRFYQLITRGTISECNKIVKDVFECDDGCVYAIDGDMSIGYVFPEYPSASLRSALDKLDLLPRPSGIELYKIYKPNAFFGFGEFRKNFDNGNYRSL